MSNDVRNQLIGEVAHEVAELQNAVDIVDEAAAKRLGINRTDLRVLGALVRRGSMTAGQLAKVSGLTPGAMTTAIDRLERAGYVRRARAADDRRSVLVEVTAEGNTRSDELYGPIGQEGIASLAHYTDQELLLVRDFLRAARELQERHAQRISVEGTP
ncbi:MAG: MarR family transcriptional regulator [Chloroflexota bacterium]|nr:MarR family transcriptional regulator [Chloroflexota bacterium]